MTQLEAFKTISIRGRTFEVDGVTSDGDIAVATFKTARTSYTGVQCNNAKIVGCPGAEVWSILSGSGREVACFAVYKGAIKRLVA